jgi:hypothetical protein
MAGIVSDMAKNLARAPAAPVDWSTEMVARTDYAFHVGPAARTDEPGLSKLFTHVGQENLRSQLLTAVQKFGHDQLPIAPTPASDLACAIPVE